MLVLVYGDSPATNTGLGIVAYHTVNALVEAGHEVVCFGVNHWVPYVDPAKYPYPIYAAGVNPEGDMFGRAAFLRLVKKLKPDVIYSCTDFQVTASWLKELREFYKGPVVDYAPVDCELCEFDVRHLDLVDRLVTYTRFGAFQLTRFNYWADVVYLGCDTDIFRPLSTPKRELKERFFGCGPDTCVVLSVARNQWRKDLARTMAAFRIFKEKFGRPAVLYLHSKLKDVGGDLRYQAVAAGLDLEKDVIFTPKEYSELSGVDGEQLNALYNAADMVVSTSLGEGWGMSTTEAFAARTPFVGPRHSATLELVGEDEERGWLAPVRGWQVCYGFDCHLRPVVDEREVAEKMLSALQDEEKVERAYEWVQQWTWERTGQEILRIVEEAADGR